jgi:hypothetical protein
LRKTSLSELIDVKRCKRLSVRQEFSGAVMLWLRWATCLWWKNEAVGALEVELYAAGDAMPRAAAD